MRKIWLGHPKKSPEPWADPGDPFGGLCLAARLQRSARCSAWWRVLPRRARQSGFNRSSRASGLRLGMGRLLSLPIWHPGQMKASGAFCRLDSYAATCANAGALVSSGATMSASGTGSVRARPRSSAAVARSPAAANCSDRLTSICGVGLILLAPIFMNVTFHKRNSREALNVKMSVGGRYITDES